LAALACEQLRVFRRLAPNRPPVEASPAPHPLWFVSHGIRLDRFVCEQQEQPKKGQTHESLPLLKVSAIFPKRGGKLVGLQPNPYGPEDDAEVRNLYLSIWEDYPAAGASATRK